MLIEVDTVKGFQDFLPPESLKRKLVKEVIEKYFTLYGFLPIETPLVEFDELMKSDNLQGEDEAVSDRFRLKDRGGRNLGLRYEFTFQLARIFKLNPNIKLPFKRYQIGENFRDEPIGPGRFRQFTQCDIDIVGEGSVDADAEILAATRDIFSALKIDTAIYVNNRKLLGALIDSVQIGDKPSVMRELDKLSKVGEDMVKSNLRKYADANQILTLFKLLEKDLAFFLENAFDGAKEIEDLQKKCRLYGVKIKLEPTMIRGLSYYTGNIFEVRLPGKPNSIAGGGRYDNVVGKYFQRLIPAVGISFGLERLTELATVEMPVPVTAIIVSFNKDAYALKLVQMLRENGIACVFTSGKPAKALDYANSLQIPYAVFVGDEEIAKRKVKIKNMQSGEEKYINEKQLMTALRKAKLIPFKLVPAQPDAASS